MIGPASRAHFTKALQAASEAERNLVPGATYDRFMRPLVMALIHVVRGLSFAFLEGDVTIKGKEDE